MLTNFISLLHCIIARFIRKVWIVNAGNNIKLARIYLKMIEFDEADSTMLNVFFSFKIT